MDAIVLAGGFATRLWPITRNRPKMFLPIGDTLVIDRIFRELEADDRIDDVYVSTNQEFAEEFQDHIDESPFEKPRLSVEDAREEGEKFGVIGALAELVEREGLDSDTLVIADHGSDDNDPEPAPDGATEVDAADEATKSEGGEESSQEGEASDDIIVA